MDKRNPVLFSWSGGKDSALALHTLLQDDAWEVTGLLTSVAHEFGRISHHGVREELLEAQAMAIGMPLDTLRLPSRDGPCTNAQYETLVGGKLAEYAARGIRHVAHGDLFLADLRAYRERNLARAQMTGVFPLWGRSSREIMETFIDLGFRAVLCCVEADRLAYSFAGREIDATLLRDLPEGVDSCGENGEYHTFVYDGPIFRHPVEFTQGVVVYRDNRYYVDLLPGTKSRSGDPWSIPPFPSL
jgi:uncharacterized protein (TIGR00290 family)